VPTDALWAYCVTRAQDRSPADVAGVDPARLVERVVAGELAVWVSRVPLDEFGEGSLRENLNDFAWLERVARRHEAVLEGALAAGTIVPLRLCTIFADPDGAGRMLRERHETLTAALDRLAGRQEWTVKLLLDRERLEAAAGGDAPEPVAPAGSGTAYLSRRRSERRAGEGAERLAATLADEVHARLREWAEDAVVGRPQNRELSGHQGWMALNGAYLVEATRAGQLRDIVAELGERHRDLGARLEVGGPLPPFNFAGRP
jgi:Gas vesicle synthesis protein GvpL/GvpF